MIYAVPDSALLSEIFQIDLQGPWARVRRHVPVTLNGKQQKYDLEGIAVDFSIDAPKKRGFWLASEGNARFGAPNPTFSKQDFLLNLFGYF